MSANSIIIWFGHGGSDELNNNHSALPLIKETSKSLLKETKRDHLLKEKETIKRPFLKRKETFKFFMRYFDRMEENCGKNVHCGYFCQLS